MDRLELVDLYVNQKLSAVGIAAKLGISDKKVRYWIEKHQIPRRSISEAVYVKHNPHGDPFRVVEAITPQDFLLFGLGIGLFWGEGNKASTSAIRIGNTDPKLLRAFIAFLKTFFGIKKEVLKFHLQIFTDTDINEALDYWTKELGVPKVQFFKPTITVSGSLGTYRKKSIYGVVTVYFNNTKAKKVLDKLLADIAQW